MYPIAKYPHFSPPAPLFIEVGSPKNHRAASAAFMIIPPQEPISIAFLCPREVASVPIKSMERIQVGIDVIPVIVP